METLLSIPFSLLHTLPRLSSIVPNHEYQRNLIAMGNHIISLWSWDPSEDLDEPATVRGAIGVGSNNLSRAPQPLPIFHPSRRDTTYESLRLQGTFNGTIPLSTCYANTQSNTTPDSITTELTSGEVLIGRAPSVSWEVKDGLQLTTGHEQPESSCMEWDDIVNVDEIAKLDSELHVSEESVDAVDDWQDPEDEAPGRLLSKEDILGWLCGIDGDKGEISQLVPLTHTPFEKGILGSMTVNEVLMIKGLIDPRVYIQFSDLQSF